MLIDLAVHLMFCFFFYKSILLKFYIIKSLLVLESIINKSQFHSFYFQVDLLGVFNLEWKEEDCLGNSFQKRVPLSDVNRCYF